MEVGFFPVFNLFEMERSGDFMGSLYGVDSDEWIKASLKSVRQALGEKITQGDNVNFNLGKLKWPSSAAFCVFLMKLAADEWFKDRLIIIEYDPHDGKIRTPRLGVVKDRDYWETRDPLKGIRVYTIEEYVFTLVLTTFFAKEIEACLGDSPQPEEK